MSAAPLLSSNDWHTKLQCHPRFHDLLADTNLGRETQACHRPCYLWEIQDVLPEEDRAEICRLMSQVVADKNITCTVCVSKFILVEA